MFGVVLVVIGLWYLRHLAPVLRDPPAFVPHARWFFAALALAGLALGAVALSIKDGSTAQRIRKLLVRYGHAEFTSDVSKYKPAVGEMKAAA